MASSTSPNVENQGPAASPPRQISPTLRGRLQKCHGFGQQKQKEGAFDAAHAMFSQCVVADPANLIYVESMLNNLFARYRSAKKKPKVRSNRANFKKALADGDWMAVLKQGPDFLEQNPWDVTTLRGLAQACAGLRQSDERFNDLELRYLRTALDGDPKNIEVNKHCAESLARMGQFDQAIACWHRIEELSPGKAEAQKHISDLTVLKNMRASGLLEDLPATGAKPVAASPVGPKVKASPGSNPDAAVPAESSPGSEPAAKSSTRVAGSEFAMQALEQSIAKSPENLENYLALAKLYESKGAWQDVERVLRRAMPVSGNDIRVAERLENVQIRRGRINVATAEARLQSRPTEENRELVHRLKTDLNRLELGIYNNRVQRYPNQLSYRFELAVCLKRAGNLKAAAEYFAEAAADPKLEPASRVQRGECLQQIRRYQEAMREYLSGAESAANAEKAGGIQRLGLYRAGVLALGLKDHHQARKIFERLAKLDPAYQDVQARLDKLRRLGDN